MAPLITVKLSSKLKDNAGGVTQLRISASTFDMFLIQIEEIYPDLWNSIFLNEHHLRPFCRIFYNSKDISERIRENFYLNSSDEIQIILALSGG
jgi:ThiS family